MGLAAGGRQSFAAMTSSIVGMDGTAPAIMDDGELLSFLRKRQGLLDGVAITGGEPCLHDGLPDLLARIRELGFATKLDTNGCHPRMLERLLSEQLVDYVAMDVKNSPEKYARTAGVEHVDLDAIAESIRLIMDGAPDYEFRTTVVHELHEADDFHAMGKMIAGAKAYFLQIRTLGGRPRRLCRHRTPLCAEHAGTRRGLT